ncbi:MAG: DnaA N-terminal domain-containing protein, partial [Gemmatimonadota bacterium]
MQSSELTAPEVWSQILGQASKVINPQTFCTWFEPTEAVALSGDELLVIVKNQFAVDYIGGQYGSVLSEISTSLFDRKLKMSFKSLEDETVGQAVDRPRPIDASGHPDHRVGTKTARGSVNLGLPLNPR